MWILLLIVAVFLIIKLSRYNGEKRKEVPPKLYTEVNVQSTSDQHISHQRTASEQYLEREKGSALEKSSQDKGGNTIDDMRPPEIQEWMHLNMMTMLGSALVALNNEVIDWDRAFVEWSKVHESAQAILRHPEATTREKNLASERLKDSVLGMGKGHYQLDNYDQAINVLEHNIKMGFADDRAKIILGLVYSSSAVAQYKRAYPLLRIAEIKAPSDLLNIAESTEYFETTYLFMALRYLEGIYLGAIPEAGVPQDINSAYNCALKASKLDLSKEDHAVEMESDVLNSLKHYNKDERGRYTYDFSEP